MVLRDASAFKNEHWKVTIVNCHWPCYKQCMLLSCSADNILFVDQGRFAAFKPRVHLPPRPKREWSNKEKMRGNNPSGSFSIFKYSRATLLQFPKYSSDGGWSQNAGEVGPFQVSCPSRWSLSLNCIDQLDVIYHHPEKNSPTIC